MSGVDEGMVFGGLEEVGGGKRGSPSCTATCCSWRPGYAGGGEGAAGIRHRQTSWPALDWAAGGSGRRRTSRSVGSSTRSGQGEGRRRRAAVVRQEGGEVRGRDVDHGRLVVAGHVAVRVRAGHARKPRQAASQDPGRWRLGSQDGAVRVVGDPPVGEPPAIFGRLPDGAQENVRASPCMTLA